MSSDYDIPDAMRIHLIKKALDYCGQPVTDEAVEEQFYRETKRRMTKAVRRNPEPPGSPSLLLQQEAESHPDEQPDEVSDEQP